MMPEASVPGFLQRANELNVDFVVEDVVPLGRYISPNSSVPT